MASLVADYGSGSESSSSSPSSLDSDSNRVDQEKVGKALPRPDFKAGYSDGQSVFGNPFAEADNAKIAILEKHVKMISTDVNYVNGKKICWNNMKNKCRFGQRCKYAHVSDIQVDVSKRVDESSSSEAKSQQSQDLVKQVDFNKSKKRLNSDTIFVKNKKRKKKAT